MIGVGQYQAGAKLLQLSRGDGFHGSLRANRGEYRGKQVAVWGMEDPGAGTTLAGLELEGEGF